MEGEYQSRGVEGKVWKVTLHSVAIVCKKSVCIRVGWVQWVKCKQSCESGDSCFSLNNFLDIYSNNYWESFT